MTHVNNANQSPPGGAKKLARLLKAWKYYCNVPISSFYLEMQAARHMDGETSIIWSYDVRAVLRKMHSSELAGMNDPSGLVGRIYACGTNAQKADAKSKLATALTRADKARDAEDAGDIDVAFSWWDKVFGGRFPSR